MTMRNLLKYIFLLGVMATVMVSCKKDNSAPELSVVETKLGTGPLENKGTIQLSSADYTATVEDAWCKIEQDGNIIHITVEQNDDKTNRSTLIHITSGDGKMLVVPITQRGLLFDINSPIKDLNYSFKGGVKKINIISNVDYKVEFDQDWLSYKVEGDTLYITADSYQPADKNTKRTAKATIIYGTDEAVLDLTQLNILSYEEFLGPGRLSFIDNATVNETYRKTLSVNIVEKVNGSVFTVVTGPIATLSNRSIKIDVTYNPDGSIQINSGQLLFEDYYDERSTEINTNKLVRVYGMMYNIAAKTYSTNFDPLLKAIAESSTTGMVYRFNAFNKWNNGSPLEILYREYAADGMAFPAYKLNTTTISRFTNIPPYVYMLGMRLEK